MSVGEEGVEEGEEKVGVDATERMEGGGEDATGRKVEVEVEEGEEKVGVDATGRMEGGGGKGGGGEGGGGCNGKNGRRRGG